MEARGGGRVRDMIMIRGRVRYLANAKNLINF